MALTALLHTKPHRPERERIRERIEKGQFRLTKSDYWRRIVKINLIINIEIEKDKQSRKTVRKKSHDMTKNSTEDIAAVKGHRKQ